MYTTGFHPRTSTVRPIKKYEFNHDNCLGDIQNVYKFKTNGIRDAIYTIVHTTSQLQQ